ncbi:hypothetical protein GH714_005747 [Hevea brasiliensis]|uniref:Uncharacterized protein n=1 Tax=Hevea brasiliensis TaxID=3981 RepID=A0A6A6L2M1_HEVBR|nr:hypothetical protein GH714_005747 [Hevea brasiliensis]
MPFLRFKKDEAIAIGPQALDLRLPFGEIEVLQENLDLIKRQIGLEAVEVLSVADPNAIAKAGSYASLLNQNPPSPGNPTAIFLTGRHVKVLYLENYISGGKAVGCYLGEIRRCLKKWSFALLGFEIEETMEIGVWGFEGVYKVIFCGFEFIEEKGRFEM